MKFNRRELRKMILQEIRSILSEKKEVEEAEGAREAEEVEEVEEAEEAVNESLSRGSLYRKHYYGRY